MAKTPLRVALLGLAALIGLPGLSSATSASEHPKPALLDAPGARELGPADLVARPAAFAAPVGERLRYAFSYWGIPLGTTSLEVKRYLEFDGRRVAHIVARAHTYAAFNWLYRIDDRAEAFVDIDTLRTLESRSWMEHRHRRIYEEIEFDWETHWVRVLRERRHSGRGKEVVFDFGPFAHDPLDLVYTTRSYRLAEGAALTLPVYASTKVRGLRLVPRGRESLENEALGRVQALRIRPEALLDGQPRDREGRGLVWIAAEGPRIPLRMAGWFRGSDTFRVGGLRAELVEYVPHAPGWGQIAPTGLERPPPERVRSREGRPLWVAPLPVAKARSRAARGPGVRRFHFAAETEASRPEGPVAASSGPAAKAGAPR